MTDSRQHPQYDMIRCKLCDHIYEAPRLLDCLHSFCTSCLEKYISQTVKPSDDTLTCPMCNETTRLSAANGVQSLRENTLLKKFICQAQKDKTTQLAGQQVLQMSCEAISETELKCPEVVASIQSIAATAGHVITGDMLDYIQMTDDNTSTVRQSLQANTTKLQLEAMDIVQGIDNVNQMVKDWEETKIQLKNTIRQRSMQIQDAIRAIERGLISKVDDKNLDAEIKNKSFEVKSQLHKILKKNLSLVDFLRLMIDYGDSSELDIFGTVISEHERSLFASPITITEKTYSFDLPQIEIQGLDTLFGTLKEITLDTVIIDSKQEININDLTAQSSSCMKDNGVTEPFNLLQNYMEVDEKGNHTRNTSLGKRMTFGRILKPGILTKQRGYIDSFSKKSLSFDAAMPNSRYQYLLSENQMLHNNTLYDKMEENKTCAELEILDEKNDAKTNTAQTENEDHHELKSSNDVSSEQPENTSCHPPTNITTSVIKSPTNSSGSIHHHGHRAGTRRLSAPPSLIIDTLNRRRLSALTILERSHINTEGLNLSSDIESGMNEARMEWLQEHVRKKAERKASKGENV